MLNVTSGSRAITLSPARSEPEERLTWERRRLPWDTLRQHWLAILAGGVLLFAILSALFAPILAPHDPNAVSMRKRCRARAAITCSAPISSAATSSAGFSTAAARR